jgi:site-specific recombinase XerD
MLADASQALETKLTEAQAKEVLAWAVQQSGQTTNPFALSSLIRTTEKLPATLTEEQAQQMLVQALQQLGQATSPYALRDLA